MSRILSSLRYIQLPSEHLLDILKEPQTLLIYFKLNSLSLPPSALHPYPLFQWHHLAKPKTQDHLLFFLWRVHPICSLLLSPNSRPSKISPLTSFPTAAALVQTANVSHLDDLRSHQNALNFVPSNPFVMFVAALVSVL